MKKRIKVVLSNAPWHDIDPTYGAPMLGCRAGSRWPHMRDYRGSMISRYQPFPFFLATASAMLKKESAEVILRDSIVLGESYEDYYRFLEDTKPDLIVLEVSTPSIDNDLAIATEIKQRLTDSKVVFVGLHAPLEEPAFLETRKAVDYTIYGEYEHPLQLLVHALTTNGALSAIPNLLYRETAGISKNGRELPLPMSQLPWPDRDSLPTTYYDGCGGMYGQELQIHTSRGCPFKCNFCVLPQLFYVGSYRMRDPQDVINELQFYLRNGSYTHFYIDDDTINVNKSHFMELCRLIRESGLNQYPWACMGRGDLMDDEMLQAMKDAGCYAIKYGVESFDRQVLKLSGKALDFDKNIEMIKKTQALGIKVHLTYCLGMLGDTVETVENTIKKSLELDADSRQYSIATPFVGSKLWNEYKRRGLCVAEGQRYYDANHAAAVDREELPAAELVRLKLTAEKLSKQQLLKRVPSQFRMVDFEKRLTAAIEGCNKLLVVGNARPPVIQKVAALVVATAGAVDILLDEQTLDAFEEVPKTRLISVQHISWQVPGDTKIKDLAANSYDTIIVPVREFTTAGLTALIEMARCICPRVLMVYGNTKLQWL